MLPQWMLILSVFGFLILVIWIGRLTSKWIESSLDFFVTGREISLLINACAIGGIGLSASVVAAMPMFSITLGFWPSFLFYGSMWAVAVIIYGLTIGGFIRRTGAYTISEWLGMRLSTKTRVICATCQLLGTISVMAANIAGISAVLVPITGYPYVLNVLAITGTFLLYTFLGGMWAVTIVDVAHIIIGMPAYYIVISLLLAKTNLLANLPGADWRLYSLTGHMPLFRLTFPSMITMGITWLVFVFGSQYYWIRLTSARSERAAIGGAVWGGIGAIIFIMGPLALLGLLALDLVPGQWAPAQAWGQLVGHSLSSVMGVWMIVAVLGASMSTASTALMGTSSTAMRDFYQRFFRPRATPQELVNPSRVAVLIAGVFTALLAIFYPGGAAWLLAVAAAWFGPPAVILVLTIYWPRITPTGSFTGIVTGLIATVAWQLGPYWQTTMHMIWVAICVTLVVTVIVSLLTQSERGKKSLTTELDEYHTQLMSLLRQGRTTLGAVVDGMKVDGERIYHYLQYLMDMGYVKKEGETSLSQVTFSLTSKGNDMLPALSTEEQLSAKFALTPADAAILKYIATTNNLDAASLSEASGVARSNINQNIIHLVTHGYLLESGLWRRTVKVSPQGREIVDKL